ncbi:hypothetical protein ScPMuIL_004597 [Solemya velum]
MSTYQNVTSRLEDLEWFHPEVDRHMAESLLMQNGVDGTYLLRNSSDDGKYVLSVRYEMSVKHFIITSTVEGYKFGHGIFKDVGELVHHLSNKPLIGGESAQVILLRFPYPRKVEEPNLYETIRIHAEFSTSDTSNAQPDFSVNSKQGFLTKLGDHFKTWRMRWFVLKKHELKYFKDKTSTQPIRVLDLNQCKGCERDFSLKGKKNLFKLVFDWRTFFVYASTEEESLEWIGIINWKLRNLQKHKTL